MPLSPVGIRGIMFTGHPSGHLSVNAYFAWWDSLHSGGIFTMPHGMQAV